MSILRHIIQDFDSLLFCRVVYAASDQQSRAARAAVYKRDQVDDLPNLVLSFSSDHLFAFAQSHAPARAVFGDQFPGKCTDGWLTLVRGPIGHTYLDSNAEITGRALLKIEGSLGF